jgi:hypothetical protein
MINLTRSLSKDIPFGTPQDRFATIEQNRTRLEELSLLLSSICLL